MNGGVLLNETGNVSLKWLGQMGFLIETDNIRLCIDYFASPDDLRRTPAPIAAGELKDVNVFIGTHDHLDHIDHEAWKIWAKTNPDAKYGGRIKCIIPKVMEEVFLWYSKS